MNMNKLIYFVLILLIFFINGQKAMADDFSQQPDKRLHGQQAKLNFTLMEAIDLGLRANPRIRASQLAIEKMKAKVKAVRGYFLPTISLSLGHTNINSSSVTGQTDSDYVDQNQNTLNLRASQNIFAGMVNVNNYEKAKLEKRLSELEKDIDEFTLIRDIQTGFLTLLKLREDVSRLENSVQRLQMSLQSAQAFFEELMIPRVHVLEAEVELANVRQELSKFRMDLKSRQVNLNTLLNLPADQKVQYQGVLNRISLQSTDPVDDCVRTALAQRPEIKSLRERMTIAHKERQIAKGKFSPQIYFDANYHIQKRDYDNRDVNYELQDQKNEYWTAGVRMEWAIFEGGSKYYTYKHASYEISRMKQWLNNATNTISAEVTHYHMALQEARERIAVNAQALQSANENYAGEQERFQTRIGTITDVLDAQAQLSRAESNHNKARGDYLMAMAHLNYSMGERVFDLMGRD